MVSLSCLTDPSALIVLDSSAVINLTASGYGAQIASALSNDLVVVDVIPAELEEGRKRGRPHAALLDELISEGYIKIVTLDGLASQHFEDLVIGQASATLDDGEAATLAHAVRHRAVPIIDERKAMRICADRFPAISPGCTMDLFSHPSVEASLGREQLSAAVLGALQTARMRVLPHYIGWVVDLIGAESAAGCRSLSSITRRSVREML